MHGGAALLALIVERIFGYPDALLRRIGHPVTWFGALIAAFDQRLNREAAGDLVRLGAGVAMLMALVLAALVPTLLLQWALSFVPFGFVLEGLIGTVFLAQKSLRDSVADVAKALGRSLEEGRTAVSRIVGRDTAALKEDEVCRAAVESLAENASDGVIAPLFWFVLFGLPGIAVYKAVNTADSMVGHKTARHRAFGWASARLDDVLNFFPARLSALLFALGALLLPRARLRPALTAALRDAPAHASPNAGWPEAALAGALGFGLGGPRAYHGQMLDLAPMGRGRRALGPDDIGFALALYDMMLVVAWIVVGVFALLV